MTRSNVPVKGLLSHLFTLDQAHEPAVILEILLLYLVFIHFFLIQTEVELGMQPLAVLVVGEGSTPHLVHFNFSHKQTVVGITHGNCFLLNKHTKAKTYLIYSHIPQNDSFILLNSFPPLSAPVPHAQTWEKMEQCLIFPYQ